MWKESTKKDTVKQGEKYWNISLKKTINQMIRAKWCSLLGKQFIPKDARRRLVKAGEMARKCGTTWPWTTWIQVPRQNSAWMKISKLSKSDHLKKNDEPKRTFELYALLMTYCMLRIRNIFEIQFYRWLVQKRRIKQYSTDISFAHDQLWKTEVVYHYWLLSKEDVSLLTT